MVGWESMLGACPKLENNSGESILSLYPFVGSGDQTQITRLAW